VGLRDEERTCLPGLNEVVTCGYNMIIRYLLVREGNNQMRRVGPAENRKRPTLSVDYETDYGEVGEHY
jgi:hypothetical protein